MKKDHSNIITTRYIEHNHKNTGTSSTFTHSVYSVLISPI